MHISFLYSYLSTRYKARYFMQIFINFVESLNCLFCATLYLNCLLSLHDFRLQRYAKVGISVKAFHAGSQKSYSSCRVTAL